MKSLIFSSLVAVVCISCGSGHDDAALDATAAEATPITAPAMSEDFAGGVGDELALAEEDAFCVAGNAVATVKRAEPLRAAYDDLLATAPAEIEADVAAFVDVSTEVLGVFELLPENATQAEVAAAFESLSPAAAAFVEELLATSQSGAANDTAAGRTLEFIAERCGPNPWLEATTTIDALPADGTSGAALESPLDGSIADRVSDDGSFCVDDAEQLALAEMFAGASSLDVSDPSGTWTLRPRPVGNDGFVSVACAIG